MSNIASWFGSGAGLIVADIAWLAMKHYEHLPRKAHPWAMRAIIVLMFMGGSALAVTVIGLWLDDHIMRWSMHVFGGLTTALYVIGVLSMIAVVVVGLIKEPSHKAATTALILPVMLAVFAGGVLHQLNSQTTTPARTEVVHINTWLKGS